MYTRTVPREIKELIREVANRTQLEPKVVEEIYFHEFEFIAKQIAKADKDDVDSYENILVKYLGTFMCNKKHIEKLISLRKNNDRQVLQGE